MITPIASSKIAVQQDPPRTHDLLSGEDTGCLMAVSTVVDRW